MKTIFLTALFFILVSCTDVAIDSSVKPVSSSDKEVSNSLNSGVLSVDPFEKRADRLSNNMRSSVSSSDEKTNNSFILPKGFIVEKTILEDFNNNSIKDAIYIAFSEELSEVREFWVSDDGQLFLTLKDLPSQNNHFFTDIDNDNQKELISIRGYEDGSDAKIARINFNKKSLETLFYFNPIIYSNGKYYWGYAWDIDSLIINNQKEIYSSYTPIERDSDYVMAENQVNLPILIFSPSKDFEPLIENKIQNAEYRFIEQIVEFSINNNVQ